MSKIVLYTSKKGSTKKCAEYLQKQNMNTDLYRIDEFQGDLKDYQSIVLCSPIYFGQVPKAVKKFLAQYEELLLTKDLHIIVNAMNMNEYDMALNKSFSENVREHAHILYGGGAYYFDQLNVLERFVVKKFTGYTETFENLQYENLKKVQL